MDALVTIDGFDYDALPPDVAAEAIAAADRIRRRNIASIFETGHDLLIMKAKLGHGNFLTWIRAEFHMSDDTAANYMNAAKQLSEFRTVRNLPPRLIYKLAAKSTPDNVRSEIVEQIEAGDLVVPKAIEARLEAAKAEQTKGKRRRGKHNDVALRRHQREQEKAIQAAEERRAAEYQAAELVVSVFGLDDLPRLIDLMRRAGGGLTLAALERAAAVPPVLDKAAS